MEPEVTERDVALLLMSQDSWVALGAMLGLRLWMQGDEAPPPELQAAELLPN